MTLLSVCAGQLVDDELRAITDTALNRQQVGIKATRPMLLRRNAALTVRFGAKILARRLPRDAAAERNAFLRGCAPWSRDTYLWNLMGDLRIKSLVFAAAGRTTGS